ncbi:MAG: hypothetical protein JWO78_466 [Micavibrio sp.]|nr:hypothetical protein [Micavibrio sp.]
MKINAKKLLLTGTALVAVSAFTTQAHAAPFVNTPTQITSGATGTWALSTAGVQGNATHADIAHAGAGDSVDLAGGATLTVTNAGVAADGSADVNTFVLGTVTNTAGTGVLTVVDVNATPNLNVTIGSASVATANFTTVTGTAANQVTANVTGALGVTGVLTVANNNATAGGAASTLTVGSANIGGATNITVASNTTASQTMTVNGTSNFNGLVTLTSNAGSVTNSALLNLNGASNTLTAGAVLDDNTGLSKLTFGGSVAQTVNGGDIRGASINEGTVVINNAAGVTFNNTLGAGNALKGVSIEKGSGNSSATFKAAVTAPVTLGGDAHAGDVNTATFDASTANFTVTGAISGTATETDNVVVAGGAGKTVTFATDMGANIDSLAVNASTGLSAAGNVAATAITLGTGSNLTMTGAGTTITGAVTGAGTLAVSGTGSATLIGSATGLTAVTVANAGSLTVNATAANRTLTATTTTLTGSGALNFTPAANTITVSNAISAAADGNGAIAIADGAGTVSLNGAVGASGLKVGTLAVGTGGGANIVNAASDLYVNTITLGAGDTLNLTGSGKTVSGTIDGNGGVGRGSIVVGNGVAASSYTFGSAIGTTSNTVAGFQVSTGSTANIGNNISATNLVLSGTENVTGGTSVVLNSTAATTVNGAFSTALTGANRTLTLGGGGAISIGTTSNTTINAANQIVLNGASTIGAGGRVNTLNLIKTADFNPATTAVISSGSAVTVAGKLNVGLGASSMGLVNGDNITVISSVGGSDFGTLLTNGTVVLQNSGLVNLVNNASSNTGLRVTANFANPVTVLSNSANASVATSLMANTTATGNLLTARGNLLSAPNAAAANQVAESLSPPADSAAAIAALDVTDSVFSMTTMRLASLRDGNGDTGMAAGNLAHGAKGWGQVFGRTATQDRREGTAGYDADTGGVAFGMDGETGNGSHLGMAVSYANTDIDSENANRTKTKVDSYQVAVYGDTPIDEHMFLNGMAAYVFNDNETTRHNVGGIGGLSANGQFDANQFVVQAELGRDFKQQGGLTLTPTVMANYSYYDAQSYTETGAGTANLNVNSDSLNALNLGVGVDAVWDIQNHDGSKLQPSLTAGYRYDVIGDSLDSNASFTGGGAAFKTQGVDPARSTYTAGAGLKYYATNNWELSARYNFDAKEDYTAHAGLLRASYKFK